MLFGGDRGLHIAIYAFRAGRGEWPSSIDELAKSDHLRGALWLNRYENLKLEPLPDGNLAVTFDRFASPDRLATYYDVRQVFSPPDADSESSED